MLTDVEVRRCKIMCSSITHWSRRRDVSCKIYWSVRGQGIGKLRGLPSDQNHVVMIFHDLLLSTVITVIIIMIMIMIIIIIIVITFSSLSSYSSPPPSLDKVRE